MPSQFMVQPDGLRVRKLRRKKLWTQDDLARNAMLSRQTIWKIETGQPVTKNTMDRVARILKVQPPTIAQLIEDDEWDGQSEPGEQDDQPEPELRRAS